MPQYQPMETAPRNGNVILLMPDGTERHAEYYDCTWLREGPHADPECTDCWITDENDHIELDEPRGWREGGDYALVASMNIHI